MDKTKILTLTVNKYWFDMILSGHKNEEYRVIKSYWVSRLVNERVSYFDYKPFTHVRFVNGYRKDSPAIIKTILSISVGYPKRGLCPDSWLNTQVFVIKFM